MADNKSEFESIDKHVFAIAALLDAQLRMAGINAGSFEELEVDYLKNWLNKEKDPLLGTIIAQLVGLREIPNPEQGEGDE